MAREDQKVKRGQRERRPPQLQQLIDLPVVGDALAESASADDCIRSLIAAISPAASHLQETNLRQFSLSPHSRQYTVCIQIVHFFQLQIDIHIQRRLSYKNRDRDVSVMLAREQTYMLPLDRFYCAFRNESVLD